MYAYGKYAAACVIRERGVKLATPPALSNIISESSPNLY